MRDDITMKHGIRDAMVGPCGILFIIKLKLHVNMETPVSIIIVTAHISQVSGECLMI